MTELDADSARPFEVLGQEVRIGILRALVERWIADPENTAASFSELREATGVSDSGQFNYHLDKLTGLFVRKTDDGYDLTAAGRAVAGAILSGSFEADGDWGPTELDEPCHQCGATVSARYSDGIISVECENGHLNHRDSIPRSIVEGSDLPTAIERATLLGQHDMELLTRGLCPRCNDDLDPNLVLDNGDEFPLLEGHCDRCGYYFTGPVTLVILTHPVLRTYYLERGIDVRETPLWSHSFLVDPDRVTVESDDPPQVRLDASQNDHVLSFLVGQDCSVLEYDVEELRPGT